MTFEEKREAALRLLESSDIWRSNYAPPLLRLLWKLGARVPPPHFVGFAANFVFAGLFFGVVWGLLMWAFVWSHQTTLRMAAGGAMLAGLLFGLCMASYYRYSARRNKIPLWKEFQPSSDVSART